MVVSRPELSPVWVYSSFDILTILTLGRSVRRFLFFSCTLGIVPGKNHYSFVQILLYALVYVTDYARFTLFSNCMACPAALSLRDLIARNLICLRRDEFNRAGSDYLHTDEEV